MLRVEICSPGVMDAQDVKADGEMLALTPLFYGNGESATAGVVRVKDKDDKLIFTGVIRIDGTTGRASIQDRTETTAPKMERMPVVTAPSVPPTKLDRPKI